MDSRRYLGINMARPWFCLGCPGVWTVMIHDHAPRMLQVMYDYITTHLLTISHVVVTSKL